ncbi:MAG TPA: TonB-dependent receptor [Candidatus Polarisedimenticolia bacterium]|nr:TonB-dependent receptor [Candidatus Polarisedimenticolia bacterium]
MSKGARGLRIVALAAVLLAPLSRPLLALPAENEEVLFDEIPKVISASRYEQGVNEAPASITVVTADEIHRFGYRTLSDILRNTRGFYVSYDRNYEYVGTRGFGRPGDYSNRILVMIDGHTHTTRWLGSSLIGNDFGLDLDLVDRVEIVRGPASALYGSSAIFGVINVITKKAQDLPGTTARVQAGSFHSGSAALFHGWSRGGDRDLVLGMKGFSSSGQDLFFKEFDTPGTNFGVAKGADGEVSGEAFGRLRFGDWTLEAMGNRRRKEIPTASFNTLFNDRGTYTSDGRAFAELRREGLTQNGTETFTRLYYDRSDYYADYVYDAPPVTVNRDAGGSEWSGFESRWSRRAGHRQHLVGGFQYEYNLRVYQHNYDEGNPPMEYLDQSFRYFNYSLYAQDEVAFGSKVLVNVGLRHDANQMFGDSTSPRAAVIFSPARRTTLKALYGTAFRVPTIYESRYGDGGISVEPNPGLKPEKIRTAELVWEQGLGRRAALVGSVFSYRMADLITQITDPANLLLQYRNLEAVTATGVEIEASGRAPGGILLRCALTQQRAEEDGTNLRLTNSPEHTGLAAASFPILHGRSDFALQARFLSPRLTLSGRRTRSARVVDATFTSGTLWPGLDLTFGARNLFDERYGDPGANEHPEDQIPQDGRSYFVAFRHRF